MRRRAVLATLGTGVFAGCSSINALGGKKFEKAPREEAVSNAKELNINDENAGGQSGRITLEKGQYLVAGFAWETPFRMEITGQVVRNGPIDLYVMTIGQFNRFQREPNIINATHESTRVESLDVNTDMEQGRYNVVFDNTYLGEAEPSGTVEIESSIEFIGQEPTPTPSE